MVAEVMAKNNKAMKRFLIFVVILSVIYLGLYWWLVKSMSDELKPGEVMLVVNPIPNKVSLSPRTAAVNFFSACAAGDWSTASTYCHYISKLHDELDGMTIIKIGQPHKFIPWFYIPGYPGVHIPYEIKLKTGEIKKFYLAIRNDNDQKLWLVDGGI